MYCQCLKRVFDFIAAFLLLLLFFPLLLLVGLCIRMSLGSPVIFRQSRPGRDEKIFRLYKFRTMKEVHDEKGVLLEDAERLTPLGRLLRSMSLDELPTLVNVLKGEMSLIGPRPLLVDYLPHYSIQQKRRHQVRPGVTGWAQINGRNTVNWQKKFELDVWYVDHCSFMLDCKIILLTLIKVIKREGIHAEGQATMTRFDLEKQELS